MNCDVVNGQEMDNVQNGKVVIFSIYFN